MTHNTETEFETRKIEFYSVDKIVALAAIGVPDVVPTGLKSIFFRAETEIADNEMNQNIYLMLEKNRNDEAATFIYFPDLSDLRKFVSILISTARTPDALCSYSQVMGYNTRSPLVTDDLEIVFENINNAVRVSLKEDGDVINSFEATFSNPRILDLIQEFHELEKYIQDTELEFTSQATSFKR